MLQSGPAGAGGAGGTGAGVGGGVGAGGGIGGGGPAYQQVVQPLPPVGAGHLVHAQQRETPGPGYLLPGPHSQIVLDTDAQFSIPGG